jgi:hypothetical protein
MRWRERWGAGQEGRQCEGSKRQCRTRRCRRRECLVSWSHNQKQQTGAVAWEGQKDGSGEQSVIPLPVFR